MLQEYYYCNDSGEIYTISRSGNYTFETKNMEITREDDKICFSLNIEFQEVDEKKCLNEISKQVISAQEKVSKLKNSIF